MEALSKVVLLVQVLHQAVMQVQLAEIILEVLELKIQAVVAAEHLIKVLAAQMVAKAVKAS